METKEQMFERLLWDGLDPETIAIEMAKIHEKDEVFNILEDDDEDFWYS